MLSLLLTIDEIPVGVKAASPPCVVPAVNGVVTLNAQELQVVPSVSDAWVADVVWCQRCLVVYNVPLPLPIVPCEFVVTPLADVEL